MMFANVKLSFLLGLIPVIAGVLYFLMRFRRAWASRFISPKLWDRVIPGYSLSRRFWKHTFVFLGMTFLIVSMLRPQFGTEYEEVRRSGRDIFIAIDTSKSMLAKDVLPSRFDVAKQEVVSLLQTLAGDRVGIIVFSGKGIVQCPLTLDYSSVRLFLEGIRVGQVPVAGTNVSAALDLAVQSFDRAKSKSRVLLLITDGEALDGDVSSSIELAKKKDVTIFSIGVGKEDGEPIPVFNDKGVMMGHKRDAQNNLILSKLDIASLTQIAKSTSGEFYHSDGTQLVSDRVYRNLSSKERKELEQSSFKRYKDRYQIPLFFAFLLLLVDVFVSERGKGLKEWLGRATY